MGDDSKRELLDDYARIWASCEYEMTDYYDEFVELAKKYGVEYEYDEQWNDKYNLCFLGDLLLDEIFKRINE